MSNLEAPCLPPAGDALGVEETEFLFHRSCQTRTENGQATRKEHRAQERATSPTNMATESEQIFLTVPKTVVFEEQPANSEQGLALNLTSTQILRRNAITGILSRLEEVMTKIVVQSVTARKKPLNKRQSTALKSLIERVVKKVVKSPETASQVTKAVINNPGLIAATASLFNSEQRKYTDERAKIEECCRQYVEAGIILDYVAVPNPSDRSIN